MTELIKCKHCGKIISPEPVIIGEPENVRQGKTIARMARHIQARAQKEQQENEAAARAAGEQQYKAGPHQTALVTLDVAARGFGEFALAQHFELSGDLETAVDRGRRSIHEATRSVRFTDQDLDRLSNEMCPRGRSAEIEAALRDLRDRYEGLGKYAPAQPAAAPEEQEVKK